MSFYNPEEADHYAKLENIVWQSPQSQKSIKDLKEFQKRIHESKNLPSDDESIYYISASGEDNQITIPTAKLTQ